MGSPVAHAQRSPRDITEQDTPDLYNLHHRITADHQSHTAKHGASTTTPHRTTTIRPARTSTHCHVTQINRISRAANCRSCRSESNRWHIEEMQLQAVEMFQTLLRMLLRQRALQELQMPRL